MASVQDSSFFRRIVVAVAIIVFFLGLLQLHTDELPGNDGTHHRTGESYSGISKLHGGDSFPGRRYDETRLSTSRSPGKTAKSTTPSLDVVISLFKENLNETAAMLSDLKALQPMSGLDVTVYVYTKDVTADVEAIKNALGTPHVSVLMNAGREAGTYFTHILKHWDELARHTLFMQAEMHDYGFVRNKITDYFNPNTGVLPLGVIESCSCISCSDPWDSTRTFPRIQELYSAVHGSFCPPRVALSYQGQIIASASRIRAQDRDSYAYLKSVLESGEHFVHGDPRQPIFANEKSNPYFGHTLERSWMVLWDCADDAIASRCGGMAGFASRRTEAMGDETCQCLDS